MEKKLYRVKKGRMLFGVAAGAGEYFNVVPTIVRLVFIGITIAFFPLGLVLYITAAVLMPEKWEGGAENAGNAGKSGNAGNISNAGDGGNAGNTGNAYAETGGKGRNQQGRPGSFARETDRTRVLIGAVLLFIGVSLLTRQLFSWFHQKYFWPVLLIAAGGVIIFKGTRK